MSNCSKSDGLFPLAEELLRRPLIWKESKPESRAMPRPLVQRYHRRMFIPTVGSALPAPPPSAAGIPGRAAARTTVFSRHGFSAWFTNRRRMVSRPTVPTTPRCWASCALSTTVQRARPGGGGPHTIPTIAACWVASNSLGGLGRGSSVSAAPKPNSRYRQPTRRTSRGQVPTATAIWLRFHPRSNSSRIRIRRQRRSLSRRPPPRASRSVWRSVAVSCNPGNFPCRRFLRSTSSV